MLTKITLRAFVFEFVNPVIATGCPKIYFVCGNQFLSYKNESNRFSSPTPFGILGY